jgi:HAD superfamily hydrolase (TIGR01549 family)
MKTKIITFDLWDTLYIDDSDEPKRKSAGLPTKAVARRDLVEVTLKKAGHKIERSVIDAAYNVADMAFKHTWYSDQITWSVTQRLNVLLNGLGIELTQDVFASLIEAHETMELKIQPELIDGVPEALASLAKNYQLAIISDTVFSPGRILRLLLEEHNILQYFSAFAFSDEVGRSKPHQRVFDHIAKTLNESCESIVHIGDREEKDIAGVHAVGGRGIMCTAAIDRGTGPTRAEATLSHYVDLAGIMAELA